MDLYKSYMSCACLRFPYSRSRSAEGLSYNKGSEKG